MQNLSSFLSLWSGAKLHLGKKEMNVYTTEEGGADGDASAGPQDPGKVGEIGLSAIGECKLVDTFWQGF